MAIPVSLVRQQLTKNMQDINILERNIVIKNITIEKQQCSSILQEHRANETNSQIYQIYLPDGWSKGCKILVCIHGISRKYKQQIRLLKDYASKNNVILIAPYFSNKKHHAFQRHALGTDGLRSDQVLNNIMADVSSRYDISTDKFDLCGFSAGAQFAHRYALRYPKKIRRLTICAAGWYTLPDFNKQFPYGLSPNEKDESRFQISEEQFREFLTTPITVAVGEYDKRSDSSLNRRQIINASQGYDRMERAITWVRSLIMAAQERHIESQVKFVLIPRSGHSFFECINYGMLPRYLFNNN